MKKIIASLAFLISFTHFSWAMTPSWVTEKAVSKNVMQVVFHSSIIDDDVSFHVFVPNKNEKLPVMYWLHGSHGGAEHIDAVMNDYRYGMEHGLIPEMVIVFPNGIGDSMWIDSKDGTRPVESILIREIIPYVEQHFNVLSGKENRIIEGFSMGGYGALHIGFSHPDLFGTISSISGGPLQTVFNGETGPQKNSIARKILLKKIYGDSQEFFYSQSPWFLAEQHASELSQTKIRIVVGTNDEMLKANRELHKHLNELGIKHQYIEVDNAKHNFPQIFSLACYKLWGFYWRKISESQIQAIQNSECPNMPMRMVNLGYRKGYSKRIPMLILRFDRNHDNMLGFNEMPSRLQSMLFSYDKNGDGKIDKSELRLFRIHVINLRQGK